MYIFYFIFHNRTFPYNLQQSLFHIVEIVVNYMETSCCGTMEQFRATEGTLNTLTLRRKLYGNSVDFNQSRVLRHLSLVSTFDCLLFCDITLECLYFYIFFLPQYKYLKKDHNPKA